MQPPPHLTNKHLKPSETPLQPWQAGPPRHELGQHLLLQQQVLEVNHLHHHSGVLLGCRAHIVSEVAFPLQLKHHFLNGWALPAYAAESVSQSVGLALQGFFDERLALRTEKGERGRVGQVLIPRSRHSPSSGFCRSFLTPQGPTSDRCSCR